MTNKNSTQLSLKHAPKTVRETLDGQRTLHGAFDAANFARDGVAGAGESAGDGSTSNSGDMGEEGPAPVELRGSRSAERSRKSAYRRPRC